MMECFRRRREERRGRRLDRERRERQRKRETNPHTDGAVFRPSYPLLIAWIPAYLNTQKNTIKTHAHREYHIH